MSDLIVCPQCQAEFPERALFAQTWLIESCRKCSCEIRRTENVRFSNPLLAATDDIPVIGGWVDRHASDLRMICKTIRDDESLGNFGWRLTGGELLSGCPANWIVEVLYR